MIGYLSPQQRALRETLPGEPGLPVLGHSLIFLYSPVKTALEYYRKYGPVYWINVLGQTSVVLIGPDANQLVLRNQGDVFSNNQGWDFFIGKFFTRGIMLLDFDEHRFHRGIMQAAFKKPMLVQYLHDMNPAISFGISRWKPGRKFFVLDQIKQLTLDIATEVFMGEKLGPEADRINRAFVDCVRAGTALVRFPVPGGRWLKGLQGRKVLEAFFRSRIPQRRSNPGTDLFSRLCHAEDENGQRFTDEDVVNHMIFLLMAAHDTSTITLSAAFYYLAKNPYWQERVRQESRALNKPALDHEDLASLDTLDRVIKESLRMVAPVHGIPRRTVKDVEFNGHHIPAGTFVMISPMVSHHLPDQWSNPEQFDPDRFAPDRMEHKGHAYRYVPFGGGAHMCIGLHFADLQIKAILHQVLLQYRWRVPANYEMKLDLTSLPTPADHLPVILERL
ncbi:MAG TPA: cytochrome P450 [Dongiaceae bacterium]|nr:cytochrome P450 [Dongiaceae bacterium]